MSFAIFRLEKHKSKASIVGSSRHMTRELNTPNADPARANLNQVLVGEDSSPADLVDQRVAQARKPLRKNGVLAVEVFLGMSPEWAATASDEQLGRWARDSQRWLAKEFGEENLVSLVMHRDESTPHLTGFVVPVDPTTGKLNASRWLDGRSRLQEMQDSYATAMKRHGLSRGVARSKAKHTSIQEFYGALRSEVGTVRVPEVSEPPALLGREEWRKQEGARLRAEVAPQVARLQLQARAGKAVAAELATAKETITATRSVADQVRDLPMIEVAERLGLKPDPTDKNQWRDDERRFRITFDGRKFYDHAAETGGGGAIDLAKHVLERDFKGAVSWLSRTVGQERTTKAVAFNALEEAAETVKEAKAAEPAFALPKVATDRALISTYLKRRGIDPSGLESVFGTSIVTDARRNVGFVMRDENQKPAGMELKGTGPAPFTGLAPGSNRDAVFTVSLHKGRALMDGKPPAVVLVESAIDAISYSWLHRNGPPLEIVSTAGARSTPPAAVLKRLERAPEIIVAFDNDGPGRKAAKGMLDSLRAWFKRKLRAHFPVRKDWNDDVTGQGNPVPTPEPVMTQGRHRGAETGR